MESAPIPPPEKSGPTTKMRGPARKRRPSSVPAPVSGWEGIYITSAAYGWILTNMDIRRKRRSLAAGLSPKDGEKVYAPCHTANLKRLSRTQEQARLKACASA